MEKGALALYTTRMEESKGDPSKTHEHMLDQGEVRTLERHNAVINLLGADRLKGKSLLDVGFGTGLFLDRLISLGMPPSSYTGIDILDRSEYYLDCLVNKAVPCTLVIGEEGQPEIPGVYDAVVCIGITGVWGMHTYESAKELIRRLWLSSKVGACVFPMFNKEYDMGYDYMVRFDSVDMINVLSTLPGLVVGIKELEREFIVHWGCQ